MAVLTRSEYGLGLDRSKTVLRPYDARWDEAYRITETRLRATQLSAAGYELRGDFRDKCGVVFAEGPESARTALLHLVEADDAQWDRYVRFRDLLRCDRELRVRYERLELELAARFPHNRDAYTDGKDGSIRDALSRSDG
jgi:GrpB-like predicted nucleotidyltransferase (UPF0157 family)